MLEFRVTKYDPTYRDAGGAFTRDEWTSIGDIGQVFSGTTLTAAEYQRIEDTYVTTAVAYLREAGVTVMAVSGLENPVDASLTFTEGSRLGLAEAGVTVRGLLREDFWCRLEGDESFVHVGWDFYMYIGVPRPCPDTEKLAQQLGLFVEAFPSPYHTRNQIG